MKILFFEWDSYLQYDIKDICREKNIELTCFSWDFETKNHDDKFEKWFDENIDSNQYSALLSVNYWPMLSTVAQKSGIKYIAWCYDNPLNIINIEETLGNEVNNVFFFDMIQAQKYIKKGFDTVHYIPLGVNRNRLKKMEVNQNEKDKYGAQVSFVGSLYESRLNDIKQLLDEHDRGYIDAVMAAQQKMYGAYLIDDVITSEYVECINNKIKYEHPDTNFKLLKEALTFAMASEITRRDRLILLNLCGKRFDTHLYSFQESDMLKNVVSHSVVDYVFEMPKIFRSTKINLNPVLRCIQSGIPLRALDVMGAGGFLLSSYQPELVDQFVDSEEMVTYSSYEEAIEKAEFYLKNEELRERITIRGRQKVMEQYALQDRIDEILKISGIM